MSGSVVKVAEFPLTQEVEQQFIDGNWVKGDRGEAIDVLNPSNNETIFQLFPASDAQVVRPSPPAGRAFHDPSWSKMPALDRENSSRTRDVDARARGNPREARGDQHGHPHSGEPPGVRFLRAPFRVFRRMVRKSGGERATPHERSAHVFDKEPLGVVAIIVPWNTPLKLMSRGWPPHWPAGTRWSSNPPPSHWPRCCISENWSKKPDSRRG